MFGWFLQTIPEPFLTSIIVGILVAAFAFYINKRFYRGKIYIVENKVHYYASAYNEIADGILDNGGLALFTRIHVDCKYGPVSIHKSKIEIWCDNKRIVMLGTLRSQNNLIKLERDEHKQIDFIYDPTPYCKNVVDIIQLLTGSLYRLTLFSPSNKPIYRNKLKKMISEITKHSSKHKYSLHVPAFEKKDEAEKALRILTTAGVEGVTIEKVKSEEAFQNVLPFSSQR